MMTLKLNRDSWHYKFVKNVVGMPWYVNDICSYTTRFFWSVVLSLLASIVVLAVTGILLSGVYGWVQLFLGHPPTKGHDGFAPFMVIDALIVVAAVIITAFFGIKKGVLAFADYLSDNAKPTTPKEPWLIETMYKHFKEKTCVQIDWSDDAND